MKLQHRSPACGRVAWAAHDRVFSRSTSDDLVASDELNVQRATDVPAAVRAQVRHGDFVVINSVRRLDLQRIIGSVAGRAAHTVWYLREHTSLMFVEAVGAHVDTIIANSDPIAEEASRLARRPVAYVPSVIDRTGLVEPTHREEFLLVNPTAGFGADVAVAIATAEPNLHVVLQESWPLPEAEWSRLALLTTAMANLSVRRRVGRGDLFYGARVVLAPYSLEVAGSSRPRVMLEAQLLGIPMIGYDVPGLRSVAASPELLVPTGSPIATWLTAIRNVEANYERFSEAARRFADQEMPRAAEVWTTFAATCGIPPADGAT